MEGQLVYLTTEMRLDAFQSQVLTTAIYTLYTLYTSEPSRSTPGRTGRGNRARRLLSFSHSIPCSLCPGISLPFFCNIPDQPPKHPPTKRRENPRPKVVPNGQAGRGSSRAQAMRRPGSDPLTIKANRMQKCSGGRRTRPSPCEHHTTMFFLSPMCPLPATMRWLRGLPGDLVPSFRPSALPHPSIPFLAYCHAIAIAIAIAIAEAIPPSPAFLLACPSPPAPPLFSPLSLWLRADDVAPSPHQANSQRPAGCGMRAAPAEIEPWR